MGIVWEKKCLDVLSIIIVSFFQVLWNKKLKDSWIIWVYTTDTKNSNLLKNGDPTTNKKVQFFNEKCNLFLFIKKTIEGFIFFIISLSTTFFLRMCVKLKVDYFISFWDKSSILSQNIVIPAVLRKTILKFQLK